MSRPNSNYRARKNALVREAHAAPIAPETPPEAAQEPAQPAIPEGWSKGQLLNVRNAGSHYNVTVLGEEYDPRHPERCLQFPNSFEAQQFVSWWYAPQGSGR